MWQLIHLTLGLKDGSHFKKWHDLPNVTCAIIIEMETEKKKDLLSRGITLFPTDAEPHRVLLQ